MTLAGFNRRACLKLAGSAGVTLGLSRFGSQAQAASVEAFVLCDVSQSLRTAEQTASARMVIARATAELDYSPHPIPVVHTQGLLPHEGIRDESLTARRDWRRALIQGLAWRISADPRFAERATAILVAWLQVYAPSLNPVDEAEFVDLLFSLDFIRNRFTTEQISSVGKLARDLADGYLDPNPRVVARANDSTTALNNWHSHRVKLGTAGAYLSGDPARIAAARTRFVVHVHENIGLDGITYDFKQRDALHYVVFDLEPVMVTVAIAKAHGDDWYHAPEIAGRLTAALDWLRPYALGEKVHEEFVNSTVDFDRKRAQANVPGYAGLWQQREAGNLYLIAGKFDAKYRAVSDLLGADPVIQCLYEQAKI